MHTISTPKAPRPAGHYSQAVVHDGLVYVAGQLPVDPMREEQHAGPMEAQTRQALANVAAILTAARSDLNHVLRATVYVSDIASWPQVNAVWAEVFGDHRPARAVVPTRELHFGYGIEIEVIAAVTEAQP
jgi:2-iminobutanoate/2-iminopropanoate deaminase